MQPFIHDPAYSRLYMKAIAKASYPMGSGRVICTLYRLERRTSDGARSSGGYALGMHGSCGRCLYHVGQDARAARALHKTVVRQTVSPCTLRDVLYDMIDACVIS